MSTLKLIKMLLPSAILAVSLMGCAKGGSNDSSPTDQKPASGSSNWGEMVWDKDNWS